MNSFLSPLFFALFSEDTGFFRCVGVRPQGKRKKSPDPFSNRVGIFSPVSCLGPD